MLGPLSAALAFAARPEEPPAERDDGWWVGLPLADVQLLAPEGGLPEANLEPLLRAEEAATQGRPLDAGMLQTDLATLYQVGEFSAVEADVEPWTLLDDAGEPVPAVLLTYVVFPAPRIAKIRVQGNREFGDRELLEALNLDKGLVFYPEFHDEFARDAEDWLYDQGYTRAQVTVRTTEPEPGRIYVLADVQEGPPNTLNRLVFAGDLEGVATDRELRRWSRREGVREGEPLAPAAVERAQQRIREQLGRVRGGLFRERRGYVSARVRGAVISTDEGARITFSIEPGSRLDLEVSGIPFNGRRKVEAALGVDHRVRLTRGWLDQAPDTMVAWLQERGWYAASATVTVEQPAPDVDVLRVEVDRGARHTLGVRPRDRLGNDRGYVDVDFSFPDELSRKEQRRQAKDLQAVLDQVSPDVIRRDYFTHDEMEAGLEAARQYYVGRGHLDAELELGGVGIRPRRTVGNLLRILVGSPPKRRITPSVTVRPGPVTRLEGLELAGAAPEPDLSFVAEEQAERVGEPYSPQRLEALARRVTEAHREQGYLEADTKVESTPAGDGLVRATIRVEPGPLVLLRSAVTRGTRYTRQPLLQRELDSHLEIGAPLTSVAMDELRADLYELGTFGGVLLRPIGDEPARDLVVELTERKRWLVEAGGGAATDQGVRAFGRLINRNVGGLAHQFELFGQVGFEWRSDDLRDWLPNFAVPEWRAATSYTARRFPGHEQQLVLDLVLRERIQERTWRMDRTGGGAAVESVIGRTRLRGGMRLESRLLDQVDPAALLAGEPWAPLLGLDPGERGLAGVPGVPSEARWQESVTALVAYEGIDRGDLVNPRQGVLLSLNTELAPGLPWPEQPRTSFVKGETRVSGYVPLGEFTLHLSGMGGHVRSLAPGVVPLEDRFRLGGTGSLRGFVRDGVGPQNVWPRVAVDWPNALEPVVDYTLRESPERWTPTGGDTVALGSIDLQMPFPAIGLQGWDGYTAELFADVGNVWLLDPAASAASTSPTEDPRTLDALPFLRVGVGAGVGVLTPVGPLRLDVGFNPQAGFARGDRYDILVRDWEEPAVRAHLTLGTLW